MMKIGMIGMSEGNGHPYSWSAIINGRYDKRTIAACGFPVIAQYLAENEDTLGIDDARVTHIWTQDPVSSQKIARAAFIEHVCADLNDLTGVVDAVILARDDGDRHVEMAEPFLKAKIPVFIDKPLAINLADLHYFIHQVDAGAFIMSCSSMRYATETMACSRELGELGALEFAVAVGKKDWFKYGVHMLEAMFTLLGDPAVKSVRHFGNECQNRVEILFANGLTAVVFLYRDIAPTFQISLYGRERWQLIEYNDWYAMFRRNLAEFVSGVRAGKSRLNFDATVNIVKTLIAADQSRRQNGAVIELETV
ncbi:gfo/Idh/MocA family oxidoreductase [candidate division KSB1 bacterium]|nr:gfo/Idh/MocA family oxidoreductase [candidate division KSB1 bacterium]